MEKAGLLKVNTENTMLLTSSIAYLIFAFRAPIIVV